MLSFRSLVLLALGVAPSLVRSHITPTGPAAGTEIQGGEERAFQWSFDRNDLSGNPFAEEGFRVDLMWGKEHWITLLARNISIYDKEVRLHFLPEYGFSSSAYYVRYMTYKTKTRVYTDKFTLLRMNGTDFTTEFKEYPDRDMTSHGSGGLPPANSHTNSSNSDTQFVERPSSSSFSATSTQAVIPSPAPANATSFPDSSIEVNQATSRIGGPIGPIGTLPTPSAAEPAISSIRSGAMSLSRQKDSAWQKVSLVLWPVLVGAVIAM